MKKRFLFLCLLLIALSACNRQPTDTQIATLNPTALNQTAVYLATADFILTQSAMPTATLAPDSTLTPITTIDRTRPPAQSSTPEITCNQAAAGNPIDITIPDGTEMTLNENFSKTWRLKNVGSCTWTRQYAVIFFSGNSLRALHTHYLLQEVEPGDVIDITVDMIAPDTPGFYQSNWMLKDGEGEFFGIGPNGDAPFWVQIEVVPMATETPQPTIMVTGTPQVYLEGTVVLGLGDQLDLDASIINPQDNTQSDILYQTGDLAPILFSPLNGTQLAVFNTGVSEYSDCLNANMSEEILSFNAQSLEASICFQSSEGRIGRFGIDQTSGDQITISFLIWTGP